MSATPTPADASAKRLQSLTVALAIGGEILLRDLFPQSNATVPEMLSAMKDDRDFGDVFVRRGRLMSGKRLLARYETDCRNSDFEQGEISAVVANFADGTHETIVTPKD